MVNFKNQDVTDWAANNYNTHISLPNISRSKGNQAMKFGRLIEYNMRNIFLEKIIHKTWWRSWSQTLLSKLKISLDQLPEIL